MTLIEKASEMALMIVELTTPRPIAEYHEDMGPVLWWRFPIDEPPYCGTPNDVSFEVIVSLVGDPEIPDPKGEGYSRRLIGGWPGYHTHWTPIPAVKQP